MPKKRGNKERVRINLEELYESMFKNDDGDWSEDDRYFEIDLDCDDNKTYWGYEDVND